MLNIFVLTALFTLCFTQTSEQKTPRYLYQVVPAHFLNDWRRADIILREMENHQEIKFEDNKNEALEYLAKANRLCNNSFILLRFTPSLFKGVLEYKANPKRNLGGTFLNYYLIKGKIPVEAVKQIA